MIVNDSTNRSKTDDQLSPQTIDKKNPMTYDVGNLGSDLGQAQIYVRAKRLMGYHSSHLDTWISNGITDMNK